jgi:hypothetical protein
LLQAARELLQLFESAATTRARLEVGGDRHSLAVGGFMI